jgi:hypothetical protein
MMLQVLPPGVQDRDEADLGTQVFGSAAIVRRVSALVRNRMS